MSRPRSSWRMTSRTIGAWRDMNRVAWPAELPPPTTATGSPRHSIASISVAA